MWRRLRQWRALPAADRRVVLAMMLALPCISLGLRMFGYVRLRRWIERMTSRNGIRPASPEDVATGERLSRLAAIAGRHGPVEATCLRQSLLVYGLLRRGGLAPVLKIGVRRQNGAFDSHAWVDLGGVALGQGELVHAALPEPAAPGGIA